LAFDKSAKAAPFLKWAGGKRQLIPELLRSLPEDIKGRRYVEPFLGAGSLFFAIAPKRSLIADANPFLIAAYEAIRSDSGVVLDSLRGHVRRHSHDHYYEVRQQYNELRHSAAQAARFIYLNMACFNGIFRVNTKNHFNVPKGSKDILHAPSIEEFRLIAELLATAKIMCADYKVTFDEVSDNDFVYIDPPYPALNDTAYFNHYTADRFSADEQERLAAWVSRISERGASFLLSNADVPSIRKLYRGFNLRAVPVRRFVSSNGTRTPVSELIITNF